MSGRREETGCLILGSGIAGLSAAIALGERGIDTLVVTAAPELTDTNTRWAQGGIIYESATRDASKLIDDILRAGCHINYLPAVRQIAHRGPELVRSLLIDKARVPFDREADGEFHLTLEGGHSESRILHRGDESGLSIEERLLAYCRTLPTVRFLTRMTAVNLLMTSFHGRDRTRLHEPARCFGAFLFDQTTGEVFPVLADDTVLATGGLGQIFLHSTNAKYARGDGLALAYRAGCRLANLEYLQFHPTTFFSPTSRRFLITEALRGEGGILINAAGEKFLSNYLPEFDQPELAPRDRVSNAIHREMLSTGSPCVFMDISHKPAAWIQERFPFVYRSCLEAGIDITKQPIPVVPGAHYHCGGIWVDLQGRTSVDALWAAGEVACSGVHGANRLASTSLLEGIVWGTEAGRAIVERGRQFPTLDPWEHGSVKVEPAFLSQDWLTLKHTMWNYVGLIKTEARLRRAAGILAELERGIDFFYRKAMLSDALIGLRHASQVALLVLEACERNPRSLGCYLREDFEI